MIHDAVLRTIGNAPLARLRRVVPAGHAEGVVKLEAVAPGAVSKIARRGR